MFNVIVIYFRTKIRSIVSVCKAGERSSENVVPHNDVAKTDKTEETLKERPSRKSRKKERELVAGEKPSIRSKIEKRLLVLPLEASIISIFLLVLLGAFYVVRNFPLTSILMIWSHAIIRS